MTVEEVKALRAGEMLHYTGPNAKGKPNTCEPTVGPRGGVTSNVVQVKVNGNVQTWKRDVGRVRAPWKYGLREFGQVDETNCQHFHRAADCPSIAK